MPATATAPVPQTPSRSHTVTVYSVAPGWFPEHPGSHVWVNSAHPSVEIAFTPQLGCWWLCIPGRENTRHRSLVETIAAHDLELAHQ